MQNTTNYNLLLTEGTDLVNYLTQTNPNFSNLDTIIKGVSDLTVTTATEVTSGTAHAISRTLSDCNVIRFVATSNWVTGDTMTIDGTTVTPLKTDGTTLKSGDYIIGATVIGVLDSTRFTVFVSSAAPVNASDIVFDNTGSELTATDVQNAIDEASDIQPIPLILGSTLSSSVAQFFNYSYKINKMVIINFKIVLTDTVGIANLTIVTGAPAPRLTTIPTGYFMGIATYGDEQIGMQPTTGNIVASNTSPAASGSIYCHFTYIAD